MKHPIWLVVAVILLSPTLTSASDAPKRNKCTGSSTCEVCENCRSCQYCSKKRGSCGVKRNAELRKNKKEQQEDRRKKRRRDRRSHRRRN